ncbi:MAG TPA: riboflavin synthase, partial [Gammaproteobacteria bacterium]|nr:riboflavin synthase [Gammaproteobacteria bacterium]
MFSGIVEGLGIINSVLLKQDCLHVTIKPYIDFDDLHIGDSVSVNGVCLTVTELLDNNQFNVTIVPETLRLTNLNKIAAGSLVNLERSVTPITRLGGHYVQGHIDGTGEIIELTKDGQDAWILKIKTPSRLIKYIVNKGYIAMDGMSLTVIDATE